MFLEFQKRKVLASLGYTSPAKDLPADTADQFMLIAAYLGSAGVSAADG